MTVKELYLKLTEKMPEELREEWDNDGIMCSPDDSAEVRRVLVCLDVTEEIVDYAIESGFDLIVSHHPLIFHPLKAVAPGEATVNKVIRLLTSGVSAMSFHTRLDAVAGGVNDVLANAIGLKNVIPFGKNGEEIGRVGDLPVPMSLRDFAELVKTATGAKLVQISSNGKPVSRVAVLGGGGAGESPAAEAAGADTYLTGDLRHDQLTEAPERGMNMVQGGHFWTENLVCNRIRELLHEADETLTVDIIDSYPAEFV